MGKYPALLNQNMKPDCDTRIHPSVKGIGQVREERFNQRIVSNDTGSASPWRKRYSKVYFWILDDDGWVQIEFLYQQLIKSKCACTFQNPEKQLEAPGIWNHTASQRGWKLVCRGFKTSCEREEQARNSCRREPMVKAATGEGCSQNTIATDGNPRHEGEGQPVRL